MISYEMVHPERSLQKECPFARELEWRAPAIGTWPEACLYSIAIASCPIASSGLRGRCCPPTARDCARPEAAAATGAQAGRPYGSGQDLSVALTIQGVYFRTPAANSHRCRPWSSTTYRTCQGPPSPLAPRRAIRRHDASPISLVRRERKESAAMRAPGVLVLQHMDAGHPGIFRDLLRRDGIAWQTVRLDLGEPIPDLAGFAALWVMGGPQDVWEEEEHPWLALEKAAIREAVLARRMPFLGICLGHQLLADALGGRVGKAAAPEIGVYEVALTDGAAGHPLALGSAGTWPLPAMASRRGAAAARRGPGFWPARRSARSRLWRSASTRSACRATSRSTPRRSTSGSRRRRRWRSWNGRSGRTGRPASPPRRARTWRRATARPGRLYANFMTLVSAAARAPA